MEIELYTSFLCPRCYMAAKHLREAVKDKPNVAIHQVDVTTSPLWTWQQGVRMIPTLRVNGHVLSGVYLSKQRIQQFLQQFQ